MTGLLRPRRSLPLLLALTISGGCTWSLGRGNRDIPEMHRNLSKTVDVQTAVVQGDLERAQAAAAWILQREEEMAFPPEADEYRARMLGYAGEIASADDLQAVAVRTGRLAAACGSCHQAFNGGPRFVVGSETPQGSSQEAQMIRHLWAADRMWEGLVGPSDEAWTAGAQAMAETRPALAQAFRSSASPRSVEEFLEEINGLATQALESETLEARADVYGRLLGTCNRCHMPVGVQVEK